MLISELLPIVKLPAKLLTTPAVSVTEDEIVTGDPIVTDVPGEFLLMESVCIELPGVKLRADVWSCVPVIVNVDVPLHASKPVPV